VRTRNHSESTQLLWCVEDRRRETRRHLGIQSNLHSCLDLGLALDDGVQQVDSADGRLTVVREKCNKSRVPLVRDLGKGSATRTHQDLANAVVELGNILLSDLQESMRSSLLGLVIHKCPNGVLRWELFVQVTALGQDANLESVHGEEQVGVVSAVYTSKSVIPLDCGNASWQAVLHVPEDSTTQVDIMSHQSHSRITRPALLVLVADDILEVRVWLLRQEALDKVSRLVSGEAPEYPDLVNVTGVESDRVAVLGVSVSELQEVVWSVGWSRHVRCTLQTK